MFPKEKMDILFSQFQRIFILPITRTTFRELQNAVLFAAEGDGKKATAFVESLLQSREDDPALKEFIKNFSLPARVAKQVQDNGDALSMLTSDVGVQGENIVFSVRIRRIDGGEFHFLTETEGAIQITEHILTRLNDAKQTPAGKNIFGNLKGRLDKVKDLIANLAK